VVAEAVGSELSGFSVPTDVGAQRLLERPEKATRLREASLESTITGAADGVTSLWLLGAVSFDAKTIGAAESAASPWVLGVGSLNAAATAAAEDAALLWLLGAGAGDAHMLVKIPVGGLSVVEEETVCPCKRQLATFPETIGFKNSSHLPRLARPPA